MEIHSEKIQTTHFLSCHPLTAPTSPPRRLDLPAFDYDEQPPKEFLVTAAAETSRALSDMNSLRLFGVAHLPSRQSASTP